MIERLKNMAIGAAFAIGLLVAVSVALPLMVWIFRTMNQLLGN